MGKKAKGNNTVKVPKDTAGEIAAFLRALGEQFMSVRNAEGAFDCFKYSLDLDPTNAAVVYNLGVLYGKTNNLDGSYRMFKEAVRMSPGAPKAKLALAEVARKRGEIDLATKMIGEAEKMLPKGDRELCMANAMLRFELSDLDEAERWNSAALEMSPDDPALRLNKVLIAMTKGDWAGNWEGYERALSYGKNDRMKTLSFEKSWHGEDIEGRTLLVISDQGSGDAIQFSRYLGEAKRLANAGRLIFYVQPGLRRLLHSVEGVDRVMEFAESTTEKFDSYSSLLGVMRVLGIDPKNARRPKHIVVPQDRTAAMWHHRINEWSPNGEPRVAIVWAGDPKHGQDHNRSIKLAEFGPLIDANPGVKFASFQVGRALSQLDSVPFASRIRDFGSEFRDFADTAAALEQMDLLVSVDTSVLHLAGCIGSNAVGLLATPPEWRWLLDVPGSTDFESVWYGSVMLVRQKKARSWKEPMAKVSDVVARLSSLPKKLRPAVYRMDVNI